MKKTKQKPVELKDPTTLTKTETEQRVELMDNFLSHPGWKVFDYQMGLVEADQMRRAISAETCDARTIAIGWIRAMHAMRSWPLSHAKACQEALEREALVPGDGGFAPNKPDAT